MANKHRTHGYRPAFEDFFPKLTRGHSNISYGTRCPAESCSHKRQDEKGEAHSYGDVNYKTWKEERGIA